MQLLNERVIVHCHLIATATRKHSFKRSAEYGREKGRKREPADIQTEKKDEHLKLLTSCASDHFIL